MSDLKATATAIWERLMKAMRDDGMLAHAITNTGPSTTQFILALAYDNTLKERQEVWVPISITPAMTVEVWARNFDNPDQPGVVLTYVDGFGWRDKFTMRVPPRVTHYIILPDIGRPLVEYRKPDTKPESEVV